MKTTTNPCNYSPSEKALRALLMLGSLGKTDLSGTHIAYGIDQVLALVVEDGMDISKVLDPGDDEIIWMTDIVKYANNAIFETKTETVKVSAAGPESFEVICEKEKHDVERVFFTVPSGDIQDMAVSVKAIGAMAKAASGIELSDMLEEENEIAIWQVGQSTWTDSRGKDADMTVFITRHCDVSHSRLDTLGMLVECDGGNIGIFDGKWYHPSYNARRSSQSYSNKAIWQVDPLIVTVPFGSFVGETPRLQSYYGRFPRGVPNNEENKNPDFNAIIAEIPNTAKSMVASPVEMAKAANWLVDGKQDRLAALGFDRTNVASDIVGTSLRCTLYKSAQIDFDMTILKSNGDFTLQELLESENGACFSISLGKSGATIPKGPYVTAYSDVIKLIALGSCQFGNAKRSIDCPKYEESSSKKTADAVFAHGYVPDDTAKYASKNSQHRLEFMSIPLTPVFPIGAALSRITDRETHWGWNRTPDFNSKSSRFVLIVDASRAGVQAVRTNISAIVDLATDIPAGSKDFGSAILVCVLPKDDANTPWTEDELSQIKEDWTAYATMAANHSQFISADDLDACLALEKENKAKRRKEGKTVSSDAKIADELRKMISDAEIVDRSLLGDAANIINRGRPYARLKPAERVSGMVDNPEKWAIVVTNDDDARTYRRVSKAISIAKLCYALEIVDSKVDKIATVSMSHWNEKRRKILDELGVAVLYDDTEKVKDSETVIPTECLAAIKTDESTRYPRMMSSRETFPISITYTGDVPDAYVGTIAEIERMRVIGQLFDGLNENFMSGVDVRSVFDMKNVPMLVRAMSFDELNADGFPIPNEEEIRAGYPAPKKVNPIRGATRRQSAPKTPSDDLEWRKVVFAEFEFPNIKADVMEQACDADMIEKFSNICKLWKTYLFEAAGMTFTISAINENNVENFKGVGAACGVDTAVQAYMIGVPIEDLIEE